MCLYPKLILNPKYLPNKKNGGKVPPLFDERVRYVPVGCGNCIECRKQKAREWQVRLTEEIKSDNTGVFVTLTFAPEQLQKLLDEVKQDECNAVATIAVRRFTERWRKKYKKTVKHWLITELGHKGTERIHLHGIIFTEHKEEIEKIWSYGWVYIGKYVNIKTINYIIKYVTKIDEDHKGYKQIILSSKGIGRNYIGTYNELQNKYKGRNTNELYRLPTGHKIALPIYYRNKIYSEYQREKLWCYKIDEKKRYVLGEEIKNIDTIQGYHKYIKALYAAQERNTRQGYGNRSEEWKEKDYNITVKMLNTPKPPLNN